MKYAKNLRHIVATLTAAFCIASFGWGQSAPPSASERVIVSFTTTSPIGSMKFDPKHVQAVWVEDDQGRHIKTLAVWGKKRRKELATWRQASQGENVDAVTAATPKTYARHEVSWDLKDQNGQTVPEGSYVIRMELTNQDANRNQFHRASINFMKNGHPATTEIPSQGGFNNLSLTYTGRSASEASTAAKPTPASAFSPRDLAIWIHPSDPSLSLILGTDQSKGLALQDLSGRILQFSEDETFNDIDVRRGFRLGEKTIDIVVADKRNENSILVYKIDPEKRSLENMTARPIPIGIRPQASCLYQSAKTGIIYCIMASEKGEVEQYELRATPEGKIDGKKVRAFNAGASVLALVADDELANLFIAGKNRIIRKYGAEPEDLDKNQILSAPFLPVQALAVIRLDANHGCLIASTNGGSQYNFHELQGNNAFLGTFTAQDSPRSAASASPSGGLAATASSLGPDHPNGLLLIRSNTESPTQPTFKLIPWDQIAHSLNLAFSSPSQ